VRRVEELADRSEVARASAATVSSTRAFSLTTCTVRRSSGSGKLRACSSVASLSVRRRAARSPRALLTALVVARGRVRMALRGVERHERVAVELEWHQAYVERAGSRFAAPERSHRRERRAGRGARCSLRPSHFDPRAELRELAPLRRLGIGEADQRKDEGDLERGR